MKVIESAHAGTETASIDWRWFGHEAADGSGFARFFPHAQLLLAWNPSRTRFVLVSRQVSAASLHYREHIRLLFQPLLGVLGIDGIHGGTLGDSRRAFLLTGRGGSGKSTLVSAGVKSGWQTLGDDFLLISSDDFAHEDFTVHSFFGDAKLHPSSPSYGLFSPREESSDGKFLVDLQGPGDAKLVTSQRIDALVSCTVGKKSLLETSSPEAFLEALLPHSVWLTSHGQRMALAVRKMSESLPCLKLTSGPDLDTSLKLLERWGES